MVYWPKITPGAMIDIIAPSGRFDSDAIEPILQFILNHGWQPRLSGPLLSAHDFLAHHDAERLKQLTHALLADDSDIIWCARGGHGATRLLTDLMRLKKPSKPKLLVGFSDITALHLLVNQHWHWPSLHAPMARQTALGESDTRDVSAMLNLWQGGLAHYEVSGLLAKNAAAKRVLLCQGKTVGTCLSLLQTSLATTWQVNAKHKIVLIEDVNETAYRLDRLLIHLSNAGIWPQATAIVLGDFGCHQSVTEQQKIERVLQQFSDAQQVPVFSLTTFGHGLRNQPLPLGVTATITPQDQSFRLCFGETTHR